VQVWEGAEGTVEQARLEGRGEPRPLPSPGDDHLVVRTGRAPHLGHTRGQVDLVLEELQVAPGPPLRIVDRQGGLPSAKSTARSRRRASPLNRTSVTAQGAFSPRT